MRYLQAFLVLLALGVRLALSELTYSVTATQDGKPVPDSDIVLEQVAPSLHLLAGASAAPPPPRRRSSLSRRIKRSDPTYYSSNWCGAVQLSASTNPITSVSAYFQVPALSARSGDTSFPQYVATWVGIDGATWGNALLQSGITSELGSTGVQTNWAWFEWVPDAAYNIASFPVSTGDWIQVTVSASSSTVGEIAICNASQNSCYNIPLSDGSPLARVDADWIVEDPSTSGGAAPLASFTDTWFESCAVETANGTSMDVDAATMYFLSGGACTATQYDSADFWASSS